MAMTGKDLERYLAAKLEISEADMDMRGRHLRRKGWLPNAGRGRHAPSLEPKHAAALVIAALCSDFASDLEKRFKRMVKIPAVTPLTTLKEILADDFTGEVRVIEEPDPTGSQTFFDALTKILADYDLAKSIRDVHVSLNQALAHIYFPEKDQLYGWASGGAAVSKEIHTGNKFLATIAAELAAPRYEPGWVGEDGDPKKDRHQ